MEQIRSLEAISDGKIYDIDDTVCADAKGCEGCSACCHGVGDLVMLTPFDIYEMTRATGCSLDQLLDEKIVLRKENKLLLPYLKMEEGSQRCMFLSKQDRCVIHSARPNICRLFPLGRVYEKDDFKYFLQVGNCKKKQLSEVTVREWIGIKDYDQNKAFLLEWHQLVKALKFRVKFVYDEESLSEINEILLKDCYGQLVGADAFYDTFFKGLSEIKNKLGIL